MTGEIAGYLVIMEKKPKKSTRENSVIKNNLQYKLCTATFGGHTLKSAVYMGDVSKKDDIFLIECGRCGYTELLTKGTILREFDPYAKYVIANAYKNHQKRSAEEELS